MKKLMIMDKPAKYLDRFFKEDSKTSAFRENLRSEIHVLEIMLVKKLARILIHGKFQGYLEFNTMTYEQVQSVSFYLRKASLL